MCCDGWEIVPEGEFETLRECPSCGEECVYNSESDEYIAASGCNYSPVTCKTCKAAPCDWSC